MERASQMALLVKNLPANAGHIRDAGLISWLGRSPGGGHENPLQYSCLIYSKIYHIFKYTCISAFTQCINCIHVHVYVYVYIYIYTQIVSGAYTLRTLVPTRKKTEKYGELG